MGARRYFQLIATSHVTTSNVSLTRWQCCTFCHNRRVRPFKRRRTALPSRCTTFWAQKSSCWFYCSSKSATIRGATSTTMNCPGSPQNFPEVQMMSVLEHVKTGTQFSSYPTVSVTMAFIKFLSFYVVLFLKICYVRAQVHAFVSVSLQNKLLQFHFKKIYD